MIKTRKRIFSAYNPLCQHHIEDGMIVYDDDLKFKWAFGNQYDSSNLTLFNVKVIVDNTTKKMACIRFSYAYHLSIEWFVCYDVEHYCISTDQDLKHIETINNVERNGVYDNLQFMFNINYTTPYTLYSYAHNVIFLET